MLPGSLNSKQNHHIVARLKQANQKKSSQDFRDKHLGDAPFPSRSWRVDVLMDVVAVYPTKLHHEVVVFFFFFVGGVPSGS